MHLLIVCFVGTRERGWVNLIVIFKMPSEKCQLELCHFAKTLQRHQQQFQKSKSKVKKE